MLQTPRHFSQKHKQIMTERKKWALKCETKPSAPPAEPMGYSIAHHTVLSRGGSFQYLELTLSNASTDTNPVTSEYATVGWEGYYDRTATSSTMIYPSEPVHLQLPSPILANAPDSQVAWLTRPGKVTETSAQRSKQEAGYQCFTHSVTVTNKTKQKTINDKNSWDNWNQWNKTCPTSYSL